MNRHGDVARLSVRLLVWWAIVVVSVVLVGLALTGPLKSSVGVGDDDVARWLADQRSDVWTTVANATTLLGDTWVEVVLAPVLLAVTWLWQREVRPVAFLASALVVEITTYLLTVNIVSRSRPPVHILDPGLDPTHSYPSGHVAAATAMYGGMAVLLWWFGRGRWHSLSPALLLLPLFVALARLYLGAHHVSDVVTSLVFMSAWLWIASALLLGRDSRPT